MITKPNSMNEILALGFILSLFAVILSYHHDTTDEEVEALLDKSENEYVPTDAELMKMDQKVAEYRLMTNPRPKPAADDISDVETVTDHVCEIKPHVALDVCDEVLPIMNWRDKSFRCRLIPRQLPEDCQVHKVNIHWFTGCPNHTYVNARKCPTIPELWISQGIEKGTAYAYTRDKYVSDDLCTQHYLLWIDTLHASSYFYTTQMYKLY